MDNEALCSFSLNVYNQPPGFTFTEVFQYIKKTLICFLMTVKMYSLAISSTWLNPQTHQIHLQYLYAKAVICAVTLLAGERRQKNNPTKVVEVFPNSFIVISELICQPYFLPSACKLLPKIEARRLHQSTIFVSLPYW